MLDPKKIDVFFQEKPATKTGTFRQMEKHSREVLLAKIALPCVAAVLAVTLLVLPSLKKDIKEFGLDFIVANGNIEKLDLDKTTIYLTDKHNKVNHFTAQKINETKAGSKKYKLIAPEAVMQMNKGWLNIKSPDGLFNQETNLLHLTNMVEAFFSEGMTLHTKEVFFDFNKSFGYSNNPVTGEGTLGKVNAEGLEFSGSDDMLAFTGKTTIIIKEKPQGKKNK